ncbi:MAG: aldo/keto reductase [Anaerolineae bacterium]|nr:aldo/keto reductase [Anaerolineae bacterium]
MQYRNFGKTGLKVSPLGFGCMRLPILDNDSSKIDEPEAIRMIRYAIDNGINYIDTAYPYHGGNSELLVAKALKDGYREKVVLATKLPCYKVEKTEDFDALLNEQLAKLETDHIDVYMLHALNKTRWAKMKALGVLDWLAKPKADGRVGAIGFSFHDEYPIFQQIIDDYDGWDFCQIQYNYMDITEQAGTRGLKYAADKGLAVVVMEPLLGGKLANLPDSLAAAFKAANAERSLVEWAFNWLWDQPDVSLLLSGMSTMEQVVEDVELSARAAVGCMTAEDQAVIDQVRGAYNQFTPIHCTRCEYCLPCPSGVNIPRIFELYNRSVMIGEWGQGRFRYSLMPAGEHADQCVECGTCEDACPQHLDIIAWLKVCEDVLGPNKAEYDIQRHPAH